MTDTSKPKYSEYEDWCAGNLPEGFDRYFPIFYKTNLQAIEASARRELFFQEISLVLAKLSEEYHQTYGAKLFAQENAELDLCLKSHESALEKSFRINVVRNRNFPSPPDSGWVTPSSIYGQLNDIIRGTVVCRYVDALPWLAQKLKEAGDARQLDITFNPEVREEGYYAFHVYAHLQDVILSVNSPSGPDERRFSVQVEIQLTTQLQDALREVTHFYYEQRRLEALPADWKWHHEKPQFRASYISHTLHLVDALIAELRTTVRKQN